MQHAFSLPSVLDGDTVHVGPGEFPARAQTSKRLTIEGSGAGTISSFDPAVDTYLNAATTIYPALELLDGGTIRRLRAQGGFGGADTDLPAPAIKLRAGGTEPSPAYDVQSVVGIGGAKAATGRPGLQVSDDAGPGKPVSATVGGDSYFQSSAGTGPAVLVQGENVSATFTGVTIAGAAGGVGASAQTGGSLTLVASNVLDTFGQATGAQAVTNAELSISASTVSARTTGVYASGFGAEPSRVTIDNSLVDVRKEAPTGSGYGVRLNTGGAGHVTTLTARNSTLVAAGPNVVAAVHATAASGSRAEATLANTVAQATDTDGAPGDADLVADSGPGSVAAITAAYSSFNDRLEKDGGTVTALDASANVSGDPAFTDPSHANYIPEATSVLIDRADPSLFLPGAVDLAGGPRAVDGNGDCLRLPDIGAYEAAEVTGSCTPTVTISPRPVRLTPRGAARVKVTCPSGAPSMCSGTLTLRSAARLRLRTRSRHRAIVNFGSAGLVIGSGQSSLVKIVLSKATRRIVRRYHGVAAVATADLQDPVRGAGTSRAQFRLGPPPHLLQGAGGPLTMTRSGAVRVRVSCPAWEIDACAGRVSLRTRHAVRKPPGTRPRVLALGGRSVTVRAGAVRFVTLKLNAAGRSIVRRSGHVLARLVLDSRDHARNRARTTRPVVITLSRRS